MAFVLFKLKVGSIISVRDINELFMKIIYLLNIKFLPLPKAKGHIIEKKPERDYTVDAPKIQLDDKGIKK